MTSLSIDVATLACLRGTRCTKFTSSPEFRSFIPSKDDFVGCNQFITRVVRCTVSVVARMINKS